MKIRTVDTVDHPLDLVYRTFRDKMPEVVDHVPNVDRIEVVSRETTSGGKTKIVNHWFAVGEIPSVAKALIKPEMVSWIDRADWDDEQHTVTWSLETFFFKENVKCHGVNYFRSEGPNRTQVELTGDLEISLRSIPGVPGFLQKKVSAEVEKFIVRLIEPNLKNTTIGIRQYLDAAPPPDKKKGKSKGKG